MDLIIYGINHRVAPVEVRERFKIDDEAASEFLGQLAAVDGVAECLLLSTCNRTEAYAVCTDGTGVPQIAEAFHRYTKTDPQEHAENFQHLSGVDAVRHIFRVAASLESQMVGESQILSQVKDAYAISNRAQTNGALLNKLLHMAFKAGKVVRERTALGAGAVSISSAAVELATHIFETLEGKSALLIGAGETGRLVAKILMDRGITTLTVANRSKAKAQELADLYGGRAVDFDEISEQFFAHDIVISATASPDYVLTRESLKPYINSNAAKKVVAIDIAVPRDIDPELARCENVFCYDMDDLKTVVEKNVKNREAEIPRAEKIVADVVDEYETWFKTRSTIKVLKETFEDIRVTELEKSKSCRTCSKRHEMDLVTKRIIKKILRAPIDKLVNDTDCTETELEYLRDLFGRGNGGA